MNAIYANAYDDADLLISPMAQGAEFFVQVRSEDSPGTYEFDLNTDEPLSQAGDGSILIGDPSAPTATITPAESHDANGVEVPTSTRLTADGRLVIELDRRGDYEYPILVDPNYVYENWESWYANQDLNGLNKWQWGTNAAMNLYAPRLDCASGLTCWGSGKGLYMYSRPSTSYAANSYGQFVYTAPGGAASSILSASFRMYMNRNGCTGSNNPYGYIGLYNSNTSTWHGYSNFSMNLSGSNMTASGTGGDRLAIVGISAGSSAVNLSCWREIAAGGATLTLTDGDDPTLENVSAPTGWISSGNASFGATVRDGGLGPKFFWVFYDGPSGAQQYALLDRGCSGGSEDPCTNPWDKTGSNSYLVPASQLKNGQSTVYFMGSDALAKPSAIASKNIRVDTTKPVVTLGGNAYDRRNTVVSSIPLGLNIFASDGSTAQIGSGVVKIQVLVDGSPVATPFQQACSSGQNCSASATWALDPAGLSNGTHTIKVVATDGVGWTEPKEISLIVDHASPCADRGFGVSCTPVTTGPVYKATLTDASGSYVTTEWVQPGSNLARREEQFLTTARGYGACPDGNGSCDQVREITDYPVIPGATSTGPGAHGYSVEYARTSTSDLDPVADTLSMEGADPSVPTEIVPANTVLRLGQVAPPGSSTSAVRFDSANPSDGGSSERTWVDSATGLPIKSVSIVDGETDNEQYYSYQATTIDPASLSSTFFLPANNTGFSAESVINLDSIPNDTTSVDSSPTRSERESSAREFRQTFGLSDDEETVEDSFDDPDMQAGIAKWGVPLDESEIQYMDDVDKLADIAGNVESWASQPSQDDLIGGVWMSYTNGEPTINVAAENTSDPGLVNKVADVEDQVSELPSEFGVEVHPSDYSYEDLENTSDEVADEVSQMTSDIQLQSVSTDVPTGTVDVEVTDATPTEISNIESDFDLVDVTEVESEDLPISRSDPCKGRGNAQKFKKAKFGTWRNGTCSPPVFGGLGLNGPLFTASGQFVRTSGCSVSMAVSIDQSSGPSARGVLTAGHCPIFGPNRYRQGRKKVGKALATAYRDAFDWAFIHVGRTRVSRRFLPDRHTVTKYDHVGYGANASIGMPICLAGMHFDEMVCRKLTDKSWSGWSYVQWPNGVWNKTWLKDMGETNISTIGGDSGGPAVSKNGKVIWGMISNGSDTVAETHFMWLGKLFPSGSPIHPLVVNP